MLPEPLKSRIYELTPSGRGLFSKYHESNLPSDKDKELADICHFFREAASLTRREIADLLDQRRGFWFGEYANRMAMLSVRERNKELLTDALMALLIRTLHTDYREILLDLSLVYHSAAKLGDAEGLLRGAAGYAVTDRGRDLVLGYLDRPVALKQIEVMEWREIEGPHGLIYVRKGRPTPNGLL